MKTMNVKLFTPLVFGRVIFILFLTSIFFIFKVNDWRFFDDDYGAIFTAIAVKQPQTFFAENHNEKTILPTNLDEQFKTNFQSVTFRPLTLCWYFLVAKFFPPENAQNFFWLSIILHAILSALIFLIVRHYLNLSHALALSIIFAFFPFNGKFIGRFVIQPYSLGMILNCLAYFFHRHSSYFFAWCLFFASLLLHEVFLSFLIMHLLLVYDGYRSYEYKDKKKYLAWSGIFVSAIAIYFLWKSLLYPSTNITTSFFTTFFWKLKHRFYDFVTMIVDICGYSFIPEGHRFLKLFLLFIDAGLITSLFFKTRKFINHFLPCLFLFCLQLWPSILIMHVSRYLYFAMPFLLLAIFLAYERLEKQNPQSLLLYLLQIKMFVIICCGLFAIKHDQLKLQTKFQFTDNNFRMIAAKFKDQKKFSNKKVMILGVPFDLFPVSGFAQAIWLYSYNWDLKIYYDQLNSIRFLEQKIPSKRFCKIYLQNDKKIIKMKLFSGAYILLHNPFGFSSPYSLGKMTIYESENEKCKKAAFKIDPKYWPDYLISFKNQHLIVKNNN